MKTWAGGGSRAYGLPPRPRLSELGRRRQQGLSNTLYKHKKRKVKNKLEVLTRASYKR
jgi:hypothetical protein